MYMNTNKDLYNSAYSKFTPDYIKTENISKINSYLNINSESLIDYFSKYTDQFDLEFLLRDMSCLELGCGVGSLSFFLVDKFETFLACDYSDLAIATANDIAKLKQITVDFNTLDVCSTMQLEKKYDFIIDSHLLHCLTSKVDRAKYLEFIKNHLTQSGICLFETMAFQPDLQIPVGYSFDKDKTLLKDIKGKMIPIRSIYDSRTIEQEFSDAGLKINYLYFHNELSFNPFDDYPDYPTRFSPKTIRLSAQLS